MVFVTGFLCSAAQTANHLNGCNFQQTAGWELHEAIDLGPASLTATGRYIPLCTLIQYEHAPSQQQSEDD